ncbi:rCG46024, isoform CRA_b [Rattus norvegicus]|uniref:RCG46024, isoform CRA_b n=1 Tax=Rattus norvegicus TaxID=10116 RepID=A6IC82_RAT|nr:rCG46024, isoform CRA_b [Rattus norvegicus]
MMQKKFILKQSQENNWVGSCSKEIILLCSKAFPTSSGQAWERLRRGSGAAGDYIYSSCFTCTFSLG